MLNRIQINFPVVMQTTAQIRLEAARALDNLNGEYDKVISNADDFDGSTQASFREAAEANRQKTIATIETILKLTRFVTNSSIRIREMDERISSEINTGFSETSGTGVQ